MGTAGSLYRRARAHLPDRVVPALDAARQRKADAQQRRRRRRAEEALAAYLRSTIGNFAEPVDPGPPWTRELVLQTAVQDESRIDVLLNPDRFFAGGAELALRYLKVAEAHGFNLRTARAVYEMGCGSARVIRHLRAVSGLELVGSDINAASTAWCATHLPGIEFHRNQLDPPLDFAKDDAFDLVFAMSVFTHIPHDAQPAWLEELARVLRPGGLALLTVEGIVKQREMLTAEDFATLRSEGVLSLGADAENVSVSTKYTNTWDVFMLRPRVLETYGRHFDVLDYLAGNQDLVVLRAPLGDAAPAGWPLPSDPGRLREAAGIWA
jgi:SAM-dependent methyltransferase